MRLEKECWRCETLNENDAERCVVCNEWIGDPLEHSREIVRLALQEGWLDKSMFEMQVRKEFGPSVEPYLPAFFEMMRNMPETKGRTGSVALPSAKAGPVAEKDTSIDLGGGVKLDLVWVAPGRFLMGSESGEENERPVHEVQLTKGFWMGKTPVTQEQWERVMGTNPSEFKCGKILGLFGGKTHPKHPVESVSWGDCQQFMKEINRRVPAGGFRLPTEAQWEYACRAGSTAAYCFGDGESRLDEYAWYDRNSGDTTHPVGEKKPNTWGLHDMHGNVWEWCRDWSGAYSTGVQTDPTGAVSGSFRVLRGGCWIINARCCRSPNRGGNDSPVYRHGIIGFRLSRSPP